MSFERTLFRGIIIFLVWFSSKGAYYGSSGIQTVSTTDEFRFFNVGVLIASNLDSPFDLERCGPAIDMAMEEINEKFLLHHNIQLLKVQGR